MAVYICSRSPGLSGVIALSMVISMVCTGLAAAAVPMGLVAARQDPAQSSSIILTTITDVVGFFSFLGAATLLASRLQYQRNLSVQFPLHLRLHEVSSEI